MGGRDWADEAANGSFDSVAHGDAAWRANGAGEGSQEQGEKANGSGKKSDRPRFTVEPFSAINICAEPEYLIEDILPMRGSGLILGESGSGKSHLASDMGLSVAQERPWAGKSVRGGIVVYVTAEGVMGFRKRMVAYRQHHAVAKHIPFYLITDAPDLGQQSGDAELLAARIKEQCHGQVVLVIIDTVARVMAGGDENSTRDMMLFVANIEKLGNTLRCAVLGIHHVGKDASKGGRGSSALKAAVDLEILVEGLEGERTATVKKLKDGEAGQQLNFTLQRVEIADANGANSCVVDTGDGWKFPDKGTTRQSKPKGLSAQARIALDALRRAVDDAGTVPPASSQIPGNIRAVSEETWRRYFYQLRQDESPEARKKAFQRARDNLLGSAAIGSWGDWKWAV